MPKPTSATKDVASDLNRLREGKPPATPARPAVIANAHGRLRDAQAPASSSQRRLVRRERGALFEDVAMTVNPEGHPGESDQGDDANLRAALTAVVASIASGNLKGDAAVSAIMKAVDEADDDDDDGDEYEDEDESDRDTGEMGAMESVELLALRRQKRARELLESYGLRAPTLAEIRHVAAAPERSRRRELARKLAAKHRRV